MPRLLVNPVYPVCPVYPVYLLSQSSLREACGPRNDQKWLFRSFRRFYWKRRAGDREDREDWGDYPLDCQNKFPKVLALIHDFLSFRCLLEWEDSVDDRLQATLIYEWH